MAGRHPADRGDSETALRGRGRGVRGVRSVTRGIEKRRRLQDYGKRPFPRGFRRLFPPILYPSDPSAKPPKTPPVLTISTRGRASSGDGLPDACHGLFEEVIRDG